MDHIYSSYKVVHHQDRIEGLRNGELILPTCAQIDLTNQCNHHCQFCICNFYKNIGLNSTFDRNDYIPADRMIVILDELKEAGVLAVEYTGGGEPQCHPEFTRILRETVDKDLRWSLVTNGAMNSIEGNLDYFKKADWIRISVDASNAKTHSLVHGAPDGDFDKVLSFINTLAKECPKVIIGVSFVVFPNNYKEIVEVTKMFRDMGCSNIRLTIAYNPKGVDLFDGKLEEIADLAKQAEQLETSKFRVFNLISSHLKNIVTVKRNYSFCGYQSFTAVIGADQNLYPCCTLRYNPRSSLGSLADNTFKEVWFGEKRKKWLNSKYLTEVCSDHSCLMDNKNEMIEYLTLSNPPHVDYI